MNGVPSICIDPHLLSLPLAERSSAEDVEDFVSSVVDWARTADGKCTTAFTSSCVLDAIDADGAFPWKNDILRVLKHFRVQSADPETVATAVRSLLNSARIENAMGIVSVLLDSPKTTVVPAFLQERLRPRTQAAFADQLAMIVLAKYYNDFDLLALGSVPAGDETPKLSYVAINTEVADIEWHATATGRPIHCPHSINAEIPVFLSRNGLLSQIEPISLWPDNEDLDQARNAIDSCIARLVASGTIDEGLKRYTLGAEFLSSAAQWECGRLGRHNFTLIESCARILLGIPKHQISEFIDNDTGKQKIRTDMAVGCRTHMTKKGAGLRLMFWELPNGTIEFANVGDKDELVIR